MRAFFVLAVLALSCSAFQIKDLIEDLWDEDEEFYTTFEPPDSWEEDLNARIEAGEDPTLEDVKHFVEKLKTDIGLQHASAVAMKGITKQRVWSRLKAVVWPELDERARDVLILKEEDVDNIFWLLNNCPEGRGHVAAAMSRYMRGLQRFAPHYNAELLADPLVSRLMQPETMDWLLDLIVSEHKHCLRKGLKEPLRCLAFKEGMTVVYLAIQGIDSPFYENGVELARSYDEKFALTAKQILDSPLQRLLHDRHNEFHHLLEVERVGPALESRKKDWETDKLVLRDRTDFSGGILKEADLEGEDSPDFKPKLNPPLPAALEKIDDADATVSKGPKYDLMQAIVMNATAAAVVLASLYIWKRRAPATGRTPRGRAPADAGVASVPAWVAVLDVAFCCTAYFGWDGPHRYFGGRVGSSCLAALFIICIWMGLQALVKWFIPGGNIWSRVSASACVLLSMQLNWSARAMWPTSSIAMRTTSFINFFGCLLGVCVLIHKAWLKLGPDAERAARELLDAEAEREATTRARASQRGARPGLRKRANRGRRRDATPRAPETDPPETKSETAAPEPKTPEPEPEPEPTRAADVQETVLEPTAPEPVDASESKAPEPEPEPEPAPVAEPRAPSVAAPVPESKVEEPVVAPTAALESKSEAPAEGFEIVARVLEHLNEPHLLPIFVAEEINDNVLPCLDPSDLIGLGVSQMTCLTILGAAHSAAKNKKLETEDVLDNVAKHQSVLEEALREHREEIKRLRIRELPEDFCCPITCEIMKDPVLCVEDGHTYERVAVEQWFATGARTSPATSQHLESTALAPNHIVRKLIAALPEEHRG